MVRAARMVLYYSNKTDTPITHCSSTVHNGRMRQALGVESKGCPRTLDPRQQAFEIFQCECLAEYPEPPLVDFNFMYGMEGL
jgi:hypothetical protein